MLFGFGIPSALMFARNQLSSGKPIRFPYRAVLIALVLAAVVAGAFQLLSLGSLAELAIAIGLLFVFVAALVPLGVIPEEHRRPLLHTIRSLGRGTPAETDPSRGLQAIEPAEREQLRVAVIARLPAERLSPRSGDEGLRLVGSLRRVGEGAGVPVGRPSPHDAEIALFVFDEASTAVRNATMRRLLSAGAESNDLRALEDLVGELAKLPDAAWEGRAVPDRGRGLPGAESRRRAVRRRELRRAQSKS